MNHYLDLRIQPDPEFTEVVLRAALIQKLHRALVQTRLTDVGIGFPKWVVETHKLGNLTRLHGSQQSLQTLQATDWLRGMRDHLVIGDVQLAPATSEHRHIKRLRPVVNMERIKRRQLRRHPDQVAEIEERFKGAHAQKIKAPLIRLYSSSTGETFPLLLELGPSSKDAVAGSFNSYGLSTTATVPWF
jgi:CRISPR-associated endonuclease Csy4